MNLGKSSLGWFEIGSVFKEAQMIFNVEKLPLNKGVISGEDFEDWIQCDKILETVNMKSKRSDPYRKSGSTSASAKLSKAYLKQKDL